MHPVIRNRQKSNVKKKQGKTLKWFWFFGKMRPFTLGGVNNEVQCWENRSNHSYRHWPGNFDSPLYLLCGHRVLLCLGKPGLHPVIDRFVQILPPVRSLQNQDQ